MTLWVCKLLMLICILTKNVITSCSVTMMLFLHLEVKPLMTLTTVLYLSCALISGHLAMMLMELTKRHSQMPRDRSEERFSRNAETDLVLLSFPTRRSSDLCKLLMLICILTKNVITSCSVTMMLFLHLEVKPLMTLTTVLYLSCALISGHLAMMLMELTKRHSQMPRD